ncbi:hypothetical protein J7S33_17905, partial [Saccharothrix algeriensis]
MGRSVLLGLLIGTLAMASFMVLVLTASGTSSPDPSSLVDFVAIGFVSVLLGGVPGTLVGLVVGAVRTRNRRPVLPHVPPP